MINQQVKKTMIDALMKVVDSAPTRSNNHQGTYPMQPSYPYYSTQAHQETITTERFNIWIDYVQSVLKITSQQIDMNLYLSVLNNIQNIVFQPGTNYALKTNEICKILLNFAQNILYL